MQPSIGAFTICVAVLFPFLATFTSGEGETMASGSPLSVIASSSNSFGNDFFKRLVQEQSGNIICSPLSANIALAMAAYGARGSTALQMRQALRLPENDSRGQKGYDSLIASLNSVKDVDLRVANKIFMAQDFQVKPAYGDVTKDVFHSKYEQIDVLNPSVSAATINSWCANNTNNRIKDLISSDAIDQYTKMILVNAVYFKGNWKLKFNEHDTVDRPFHLNSNTIKQVPTMFVSSNFLYGQLENLDAQFIELPYKNENISMVIVVPNKIEGLRRIEENINSVDFNALAKFGRKEKVELFLPKFKIETTIELNDLLEKMGMAEMFSDNADFSGVADIPLKVSKVVQKAFIEVNEEGSEAAAATSVITMTRAMVMSMSLEIDRPFFYAIVHTGLDENGSTTFTPLFTGHVVEP